MKLISTDWHRLWLFYNFFGGTFGKGTQPYDFLKFNVIQKLAYNIKYISQINGGLPMFFGNSRFKIF